MKILYLSYGPQSGVVQALSQELRKRGHEIIISDVASPVKLPRINGSTMYLTLAAMLWYKHKWFRGYFRTKAAFETMSRKAESVVAKTQPDMVLQSGCLFGLTAPTVPYVLYLDHTHAISQSYIPRPGLPSVPRTSPTWVTLERATYQHAHRILATHEFVRDSLVSYYGVSDSKIQVVNEGPIIPVTTSITQQHDDGKTVLFAGRPFKNKGGLVLLSAMSRVRQLIPDAHLVVVGADGPSDKDVTYAGWIPNTEITAYYQKATVFTLPTLHAGGLVLLEAMTHGLPCVGTNTEAVAEIIADGETGFLVPPGNDEALAECLIRLLRDPELRRRMGNAGRARVEKHFSWQRVAIAVENSLSSNTSSMEQR